MKITYKGQECDVPQWAIETAYNNGYAKGVKEFAERLKEELTGWETDPTDEEIKWVIDNLVKEMVGADNV